MTITRTDNINRRLLRYAYHEAGHAIAAWHLGHAVHGLMISADRGGGCFVMPPDGTGGYWDAVEGATIYAAGEAGEAMADELPPPPPPGPPAGAPAADLRSIVGAAPAMADPTSRLTMAELCNLKDEDRPDDCTDFGHIEAIHDRMREAGMAGGVAHDWYARGRDVAESLIREHLAEFRAVAEALYARCFLSAGEFLAIVE